MSRWSVYSTMYRMLGLVLALGMVGQCSGHAYLTIPQARGDAGTSVH